METKKYATYLRVSTQKQGASGLGLDAQRKMCNDFIMQNEGEHVQEFIDVESGTHRDRKGLQQAIAYCQMNDCGLVIAKLDRLARDVEFCFKVINTGIEIHFVDMPQINTLLLGVFASVAQYERELTSDRTKKALAAKRQRGEVTGGASERWRMSFINKSKQQKEKESMKRGATKNRRWLESRNVVAFRKVIRSVFPDATNGTDDVLQWDLKAVNTRGDNKVRMLSMMRDYRELDPSLFKDWDFTQDFEGTALQVKLATYINSLRRAVNCTKSRMRDAEDERIVARLLAEDAACEC